MFLMESSPYAYLLVNLFSISIPFLLTFEKRVHYFKKWKYLFPSIGIMAVVFISWDALFTKLGVWGFNDDYLLGYRLLGLPLEEWLFFFCIPYSCLFIYEVLAYFFDKKMWQNFYPYITWILMIICVLGAVIFHERLYTLVNLSLTAIFLIYLIKIGQPDYLGRFYIAYLISFIPFFLVNGILTGTGIQDQIVWYNNDENIGFRLGTIPVEDTIYSLLMLLSTTHFF